MQTLKSLSLVLSAALLLGACSSTSLDDKASIEDRNAKPVTTVGNSSGDPRTVAPIDTTSTTGSGGPTQGILAQRSVYFDYDSYIVKDEFKPLVEAHAKYLGNNKVSRIIIQGNTDERGGSEYNLALGQKRAEAVRKSMALLGVPDSQMEAVSFGKEKPKAQGSDEAAWAENRRADIVY
ncbi:peptidoglycan-associated lipoprotein Pal [soil metagenome]